MVLLHNTYMATYVPIYVGRALEMSLLGSFVRTDCQIRTIVFFFAREFATIKF